MPEPTADELSAGQLMIGRSRDGDEAPASLEPASLLRHAMALGSSGSGKTVLCKILTEECARLGIPALCLDPQGDLCSLALCADDPGALAEKGIDPELARAFADKVDPVIFTPASRKGIAICADPLQSGLQELDPREQMNAISGIAAMLVSLLGYDLDSDDGNGLVAVMDQALNDRLQQKNYPSNLEEFSRWFQNLDEDDLETYHRYLDKKKLEKAIRRLARLDVGTRKLMFHQGFPLNIDMLLGKNGSIGQIPGKTRISIVYLNTLHSQEDKEFFVASLVDQLYRWMLNHPSTEPQALFYIDEVAPYIPPTRKPACKPGLSLLFKQARKYGIGCLMATQNPADVDYKAMSQFGTWAIGRITTQQDMKKVQPVVKSLDPVRVDQIMEELPSQKAGQFTLISPDNFESSLPIQSRWLYTRHETLDDDGIEELAAGLGWKKRFIEPALRKTHALKVEVASEPEPEVIEEPEPEEEPEEAVESEPGDTAEDDTREKFLTFPSVSAAEFAKALKISEGAARSRLRRLVEAGHAETYKDSRTTRYWSRESGFRPDLGIVEPVRALIPQFDTGNVTVLATKLAKGRFLGLFGTPETLEESELEYRLTLRLTFREKIERGTLQRLFGRDHDEHLDSIYMHPANLKILVYDPLRGIRFHDRPDRYASRIRDFDGLTETASRLPGEITLRESDWQERPADKKVLAHFRERFEASLEQIEPVLVPVWKLHYSKPGRSSIRVTHVDALSGNIVDWPNG